MPGRWAAAVVLAVCGCTIGMYFNLVLPTSVGGDVVRAWYLDRSTGRRMTAFLSVFIDRLSGLVVLVALAAAATLLSPVPLPWWIPLSVASAAAGTGAGCVLLPFLARRGFLGAKFVARADELRASLTMLLQPTPVVLSLIVQAANAFLVWLIGLGLGLDVPLGYYAILVPMVSLLTLLPVSINGMGVREGHPAVSQAPGVSPRCRESVVPVVLCLPSPAYWRRGILVWPFSRPEVAADNGPVDHHSDQGRADNLSRCMTGCAACSRSPCPTKSSS